MLALIAGASVGLAIGHGRRPDLAGEVALGGMLFLVAAIALFQDPRLALTIVALGFAATPSPTSCTGPVCCRRTWRRSGIL